jgi:benzoyl-CoA reductase/2-hydroxyglutaryl-CoA dehydratase subunit BcrC/BadD/HgdB
MYVGETTCDGKKKAWEILAEDVPVHVMDLPQMKRPKDIAAWADEIKTFLGKVEEFTGNKVTSESLANAIRLINDKRRALARLYSYRKNENLPISGKDILLISQIAFYDDPTRFTSMTNKLCDELEERVKNNVSVFPAGTKRIMLTGTPLAIPNWKLHHIIETSGAAVVVEEMCTGTRYFENLVDETKTTIDEQLDALSNRYMGINCACFTPNEGRIKDILRLAEEYQVDGIIDVNLKFCNLYDTEGYKVERAIKEAGIPVLGIETDYTDQDAEQLRTRIGAFVEMLGTNQFA